MFAFDLAQLKAVSADNVLLLRVAHAVEEQPRLGEVVGKGRAALADLVRFDPLRIRLETAITGGGWRLLGPAAIN
ncbi:hypothetical protein D3C77_368810 [compost metagenome]